LNFRTETIRFGPGAPGIGRADVYLTSHYELHRHDTYAIGVTTAGVQTFRYRGSRHVCLPGQLHVLHPDEPHDGAPATRDGFGYRIIYIAPALVHEAVGGRALPFVADPVQEVTPAARPVADLAADVDEPMDELRRAEFATAVADGLLAMSCRAGPGRSTLDVPAVQRVRDYLEAHAHEQTSARVLESIAGTDRFTITRHFRRAFGTSPDRYRTLRRLESARAMIEGGHPLARAAVDCGFADQSHMTRQFKRTYGLTPSRWRALTAR